MKIPKKQSDILLKTYLEYEKFIKELSEEKQNDEKYVIQHTLKIFYGIDEESFSIMEYHTVLDLMKIIENILLVKQKLVPFFTHKGIDYGINPNFNDMTLAEMVDCDTTDILRQICILYRPILKKKGNKYSIKKYEADIEIYDELKETLTLDIYNGFVGFFLRISKTLLKTTLNSLMEMDITPEMRKNLEKYGVGIRGYTDFVMEI